MSEERKELNEVEIGVALPDGFIRKIYTTVDKVPRFRRKYKNTGVYVTAYRYEDAKNRTDESLLIGDLYIDLDNPDMKEEDKESEAFETVREDAVRAVSFLSAIMGIHEDMIKIYYSGQKGLHITVASEILGITPMKELNHVYKVIAKEIHRMSKNKTVDLQIYDNARLFSIPRGRHAKTGRYKIPLTFKELRELSFEKIKRLAEEPRKVKYKRPAYSPKASRMFRTYIEDWEKEKKQLADKSGKRGKKTLDFMPPCIKSILNRPCTEGYRNHTAAALSSYYRNRGMKKEDAWHELCEWNSKYAGLTKGELSTTFESIFNRDYSYGCNTLALLGDCVKDSCKIGKGKIRKQKQAEKEMNKNKRR